MSKKTIIEAIVEVLKKESKGLTSKEIYQKIVKLNLYQFKSSSAGNIVRNQLRRHCNNIKLMNSSKRARFIQTENGHFTLIP